MRPYPPRKKKFKNESGRHINVKLISRIECSMCCNRYQDCLLKCPYCGLVNYDRNDSIVDSRYIKKD